MVHQEKRIYQVCGFVSVECVGDLEGVVRAVCPVQLVSVIHRGDETAVIDMSGV